MLLFWVVTPCGHETVSPHSVTTQNNIDIFTAVRNSDLMCRALFVDKDLLVFSGMEPGAYSFSSYDFKFCNADK
jgi:hypothetical protein